MVLCSVNTCTCIRLQLSWLTKRIIDESGFDGEIASQCEEINIEIIKEYEEEGIQNSGLSFVGHDPNVLFVFVIVDQLISVLCSAQK